MQSDPMPTIFVALILAPGQHDLLDELEAEAIDLLGARSSSKTTLAPSASNLLLLDQNKVRLALAWTSSNGSDVLSLAIGSTPNHLLSRDDAQKAGETLRLLVQRAEALFEVRQTHWQISLRTLDAEALNQHANQIESVDQATSIVSSDTFISMGQETGSASETDNPGGTFQRAEAVPGSQPPTNWTQEASTLAMSTAFVLVTPPVGVAMFTYAVLRKGSDMAKFKRKPQKSK